MSEPTFLGHPRGLVLLFLVEMWERFFVLRHARVAVLRDLRCDFVRCWGAALHAGTQDQQAYRWI
ncbi:MAG: hypothetical protein ABIZ73_07555 [Gemmatimonadaceae bacterium]